MNTMKLLVLMKQLLAALFSKLINTFYWLGLLFLLTILTLSKINFLNDRLVAIIMCITYNLRSQQKMTRNTIQACRRFQPLTLNNYLAFARTKTKCNLSIFSIWQEISSLQVWKIYETACYFLEMLQQALPKQWSLHGVFPVFSVTLLQSRYYGQYLIMNIYHSVAQNHYHIQSVIVKGNTYKCNLMSGFLI